MTETSRIFFFFGSIGMALALFLVYTKYQRPAACNARVEFCSLPLYDIVQYGHTRHRYGSTAMDDAGWVQCPTVDLELLWAMTPFFHNAVSHSKEA